MLQIDGKHGEGGGQILRTSVSLSAVTGKPIRIFDIRAARRNPGIQKQHLQSILAAAEACNAECEGAQLGSSELVFHPGEIKAGHFKFDIRSAGSTTLVFQTILPILLQADDESTITIKGGTHNPMAPPFETIRDSFLPAIGLMGFRADIELVRHGFYPKGGGEIKARVEPFDESNASRIDLTDRDGEFPVKPVVLISNLPLHIAEREREVMCKELGCVHADVEFEMVPAPNNPGNAVSITALLDGYSVVFSSIGERGKRAERVAKDAASDFKAWRDSNAAIDYHLADQLLLYLALAGGGRFTTDIVTRHLETNSVIIREFMDVGIGWEDRKGDYLVSVNV